MAWIADLADALRHFIGYFHPNICLGKVGPASAHDERRFERRAVEGVGYVVCASIVRTLDDIPHTRYVEHLGALPTLVMSGALSTRAGRSCARILAEVMPRGTHVELDEVGHMAPVLASREVAAHILEHIEACEA